MKWVAVKLKCQLAMKGRTAALLFWLLMTQRLMIEVSNVLPVLTQKDIDTAIKWALANDATALVSKQTFTKRCRFLMNTLLQERSAWPIANSVITAGSIQQAPVILQHCSH